jgi:hypothetical protein
MKREWPELEEELFCSIPEVTVFLEFFFVILENVLSWLKQNHRGISGIPEDRLASH